MRTEDLIDLAFYWSFGLARESWRKALRSIRELPETA